MFAFQFLVRLILFIRPVNTLLVSTGCRPGLNTTNLGLRGLSLRRINPAYIYRLG
jgi:hypothetical protein